MKHAFYHFFSTLLRLGLYIVVSLKSWKDSIKLVLGGSICVSISDWKQMVNRSIYKKMIYEGFRVFEEDRIKHFRQKRAIRN